jgi:hypothetical protein
MKTIRLKITHPGMDIYENNPNQAQVFTYELGKVCNQLLDNWHYAPGILTIDYCDSINNEPDPHRIRDRVLELCSWQQETAE